MISMSIFGINETGIVNNDLLILGMFVFLQSTLGSMMSIYSEAGDFDSVEVSGDVVFSMSYDEHTHSLQVFIKECRGLAYADASRKISHPCVLNFYLFQACRPLM